ncbi:hypothetical protein D3C76_1310900 [compost metagenome]
MRGESALCSWGPISAAPHPADSLTRLHYISDFNIFFVALQMGVIMISVGQVANTDSPSAVRVPAFSLNNSVADAANRNSIRGEKIGSFMSSQPAPSPSISPSIPESVDTLHGKRKCAG